MTIKSSLTILLALHLVVISNAQSSGTSSGRVKGQIFDYEKSVVMNAKVIFAANGRKRETLTNAEGYYEIELPVGIYQITTYSGGFCPAQRALLRVRPSSETLINLTLVVCPLANILTMDKSGKYIGEEDRYIDPLKSESFPIRPLSGLQLNLVVRYRKREERKAIVEYQSDNVLMGMPPGVTITYDVLTIVADKARLNKKTLLLEAEGDVTVEDGKQRINYSSAKINFKSKDPIGTLTGEK